MNSDVKKRVAWSLDVLATLLVIWGLLSINYAELLRSVIEGVFTYQSVSAPAEPASSKE